MAARMRDRLAGVFGAAHVFMDVDNLLAGQRFDKELEKALVQTDVFLAVIGPRWIDLFNQRRASGERDYVHEEISGALKRGIMVVPILIEGTPLPRADALPEDIRELVLHQKHAIGHEQFGRDVAGLADAIRLVRKSAGSTFSLPSVRAASLGWMTTGAVGAVSATWVLAYYSGVPVPWPWSPPGQNAASRASGTEALQKQLANLNAEVGREQEARGRAEVEAKRQADLASMARRDLEGRQKAEAEVAAKRKVEEDRQARAATEAERQRLAAIKIEEDRQRVAAEARRKSEEDARRAAVDAKAKSDEEARRTAELQRLKAEQAAKAQTEADARRQASAVATMTQPPPISTQLPGGAVLFGVQNIGFVRDRDLIIVGENLGQFDRVQLRVLENSVHINDLEIVYVDSTKLNLVINSSVEQNTRTRWLDIGGTKFIKEINVSYRSRPGFKGQARIEVYGQFAQGWLGANGRGRQYNEGWVLLGAQTAGRFLRTEIDRIEVGRNEGLFKSIRVTVKDRALVFDELHVVYGNGAEEVIPIKTIVAANSTFGPVALKGGNLAIRELRGRYRSAIVDAKAVGRGAAVVEIWARY